MIIEQGRGRLIPAPPLYGFQVMFMDKQIKRIEEMEKALNRAQSAVNRLESAVAEYSAVRDDLSRLEDYLNSEERMRDIEADEAGRLPSELRRGVLSEDALWNLLEQNDILKEAMRCIVCPDEL